MTPNKFGVGIIGCGAISGYHVKAYAEFPECELKAVADISLDKARQLAASAGDGVEAYESFQALLARDDIDIVSICTPPFAHKETVIASLLAGKHVLCEKPFAPSLQDCDEMIEAARKTGRKLAVTFQYRYRKDFNQMKRIVDSGVMGPPVFAQMNGLYWRGDDYYNVPWRGKFETECGGVTMNHAIHPLDVFLWIMGDLQSVTATAHTVAHQIEVEDMSTATATFKNGATAQLTCTLNSVKQDISLTVSGKTKAIGVTGAFSEQPLSYHAVKDNGGGFSIPDPEGAAELQQAASEVTHGTEDHTGPIGDLLAAIREDREPVVNGLEGRRTIEAITAIYKSAAAGTKVTLPLAKDDPWYTTDGILRNVKR
ncbi:Gfo/Idh/MocA family protein [Paenibacillus solisilvae]|uniref:Gfo/Idh/MocA family protein n=1 Tax=Paenibacillus solisilvae TaxID=2486751 RepID=A0ABW0VVS9_9BACL